MPCPGRGGAGLLGCRRTYAWGLALRTGGDTDLNRLRRRRNVLNQGPSGVVLDDSAGRGSRERVRSCVKHRKAEILHSLVVFQPGHNQTAFLKRRPRQVAAVALERGVVREPFGNGSRTGDAISAPGEHVRAQPRPDQLPGQLQGHFALDPVGPDRTDPASAATPPAWQDPCIPAEPCRIDRGRPEPERHACPTASEREVEGRWDRGMSAFPSRSRWQRRRSWSPPTWQAGVRSRECDRT